MLLSRIVTITKTICAIRGYMVTNCRRRGIRVCGTLFHYTQISPRFKGKLGQFLIYSGILRWKSGWAMVVFRGRNIYAEGQEKRSGRCFSFRRTFRGNIGSQMASATM